MPNPENPLSKRPRWLNVITTGNLFSMIAALVGAAPAFVLLWNVGQWPITVGRQIETLVRVTSDMQKILNEHSKDLSDTASQIAALRGELIGIEINLGKATK